MEHNEIPLISLFNGGMHFTDDESAMYSNSTTHYMDPRSVPAVFTFFVFYAVL